MELSDAQNRGFARGKISWPHCTVDVDLALSRSTESRRITPTAMEQKDAIPPAIYENEAETAKRGEAGMKT